MNLLEDDPISSADQDALRHDDRISLLSREVELSASAPGKTVALYGPWGSGKTSALNLLKKKLQEKVTWVGFDAWQYQAYGNVVIPLLHAMYRATNPSANEFVKTCRAIFLNTVDMALRLTRLSIEDINKNIELLEREALPLSEAEALKDYFHKWSDKLGNGGKQRVVVAIDNLDRCEPEAVMRLLEVLFLVMDTQGVSILVAVDQDAMISFIQRKYEGAAVSGARYLEKVFPNAVRIPDPWVRYDWDDTHLAEEDDIERLLDATLKNCAKWIQEEKELLWTTFSQPVCLRNPRRIKRILRQMSQIDPKRWEKDERWGEGTFEAVLILVIFSNLWPTMLRKLNSSSKGQWLSLIKGLAGQSSKVVALGNALHEEGRDSELCDFVRLMAGRDGGFDSKSIICDQELLFENIDIANSVGV